MMVSAQPGTLEDRHGTTDHGPSALLDNTKAEQHSASTSWTTSNNQHRIPYHQTWQALHTIDSSGLISDHRPPFEGLNFSSRSVAAKVCLWEEEEENELQRLETWNLEAKAKVFHCEGGQVYGERGKGSLHATIIMGFSIFYTLIRVVVLKLLLLRMELWTVDQRRQ